MPERLIDRRRFCASAAGLGAATIAFGPAAATAAARVEDAGGVPEVIGSPGRHVASHEDTLIELARRYNLGFNELAAANRDMDPWIPGEGSEILLPSQHILPSGPRQGLLLNLVDQRLYYFPPDGGPVETHPIGTGREARDTPLGQTKIVRKQANPTWYPPASARAEDPTLPSVVRPGPNNPLGQFAMYLGWPLYLIHGTNRPYGVGRRVSRGCIRLYPEDIARLFPLIPVGTQVTVVAQEAKIAWHDRQLLLEIHPTPQQGDELEAGKEMTHAEVPELAYLVSEAAGPKAAGIDWDAVRRAEAERTGVPVPILEAEKPVSSES